VHEPAFRVGSVRLEDARRLAYREIGPVDGWPVLHFHGAIGAPIAPPAELLVAIERFGVRWICVQRPGFGASLAAPGRCMIDFAADVARMLELLSIHRVAVVGVSAGGPYALACAHKLPQQVRMVAVCSSLSPFAAPYELWGVPVRIRLPLRALAAAPNVAGWGARPAAAVLRWRRWSRRTYTAALRASTAHGVQGLIDDCLISCQPWGFEPGDVCAPVHLWHGAQDRLVPVEYARRLATSLPQCQSAYIADGGHFLFRWRVGDIVAALARETKTGAQDS
jgi:pimeloyl-ACP methyl ester carboxylesterase